MKILQISPTFIPSKFCGVKTVSYQISRSLANCGHSITVFTTDAEIGMNRMPINGEVTVENIHIKYFKNCNNMMAYKFHFFLPIGFFSAIRKKLPNFDIIHIHDYRGIISIITHHYAKKYRIPYIVQAHGSVLPAFEKQGLKKLFDRLWGDRILRDASKCIAVSKAEKMQYLQMGVPENKIEVIPNGIAEFDDLPERGRFRKKYGIASDEKVVLYLGRLHKRKGIDFLIDGFAAAQVNQNYHIKLVIVGPDDGVFDLLKLQIKQLEIEEHVIFTGSVSETEKYEAYVDADLLVYPGILEIFGLVPFEAIQCGTPVIVSNDCGCGEIIQEAKCGSVVKYGDIADLKEKIIEILSNPYKEKEKIKYGQQYIKENLSYASVIKKNFEVYTVCKSEEEKKIS